MVEECDRWASRLSSSPMYELESDENCELGERKGERL